MQKNIEEMLSEFDLCVTPSLGDIRDNQQFNEIINKLRDGFELLSSITDNFDSLNKCSAYSITERLIDRISDMSEHDATSFLREAISVLFLVTGKTDNNIKCQFPLYLLQRTMIEKYPYINNGVLAYKPVPRLIKADSIVKTIVSLINYQREQRNITEHYFRLILSDEEYIKQLWSIGHSYTTLKQVGAELSFISSLAIFMCSPNSQTAGWI